MLSNLVYTVTYIYIGYSGATDDIRLVGDRSGAFSLLYGAKNNYAYGNLAAQNSTFISTLNSAVFRMYGNYAGYGATILCGDGLSCTVNCYAGTGWNGLTLACENSNEYENENETDTCNFNVNCNGAEKSDVCPDGYWLDDYLTFEVPSLIDAVFSTEENSYDACFSSITNAINCQDYGECKRNSDEDLTNIMAPICCTSYEACFNVSSITTNNISLNSSGIYQTAIRCDGEI